MKNHNLLRATYLLNGPMSEKHESIGYELWICYVTNDVLGGYLKSIYVHDV